MNKPKEHEKATIEEQKDEEKREEVNPKQVNPKEVKVTGIGTSISNVLDKKRFEKDCNVKLRMVKAYCIDEEENARFKESNFAAVVPKVTKEKDTDVLVLQTGSIEITDLDMKQAMKDTKKSIEEYKREWFAKVEKDSINVSQHCRGCPC